MELWGLDPTRLKPRAVEEDELWSWHLPALAAWEAVSGQMRAVAVGGGLGPARLMWIGLDAAAVKAALDLGGIALAADDWPRLQAIAAGACEELNG